MNTHLLRMLSWIFFILFMGCASKPPAMLPTSESSKSTVLPEIQSNPSILRSKEDLSTVVLNKNFFVIHYDPNHRLAKYVEYRLTAENLKKSFVRRKNRFHAEIELFKMNMVPVGSDDYRYSGYDRGHLAPSGDFEWSEEANDSTFTMANIVPQKASLNRVAWRGLESQIRGWACAEGELRIVTGPILDIHLKQTSSGVVIPQRFFKVVLDETPPRKTIGFIFEQSDYRFESYRQNVVTVRDVENLVGVDFFSDLSLNEQNEIENIAELGLWHGVNCKESNLSELTSNVNQPVNFTGGMCKVGTLKSASIQGCCSGHKGVMGPKKHRACCNANNAVICNDGTISASCRCSNK